jgi:tetratricopeptide (TPR) repeat protein
MRCVFLTMLAVSLMISPAVAQKLQEANSAYRKQNYDRAIELYNALLEKTPDDARIRSQRAHALVERAAGLQAGGNQLGPDSYAAIQRDAQQAIDDLTAAITAGIGAKGISQTWRGRAYLLLHRHDEALADLNSAIEQKPDRATAYYYRGLLHRQRGQTDEAFADFHTALRYKPEDALAYRERARCQLNNALDDEWISIPSKDGKITWAVYKVNGIKDLDKITMAVADFERALAVDPEDCESRRALIDLYSITGESKRCLEQLDEICKRQPENFCSWYTRSRILASHSSPEFRNGAEAIKAAQKALEISKSRSPGLLMNLAAAHAEAGEHKMAVTTAKEALQAIKADEQFPTIQDHPYGEAFEKRLELFRKKQPYRDPNLQDFSKK